MQGVSTFDEFPHSLWQDALASLLCGRRFVAGWIGQLIHTDNTVLRTAREIFLCLLSQLLNKKAFFPFPATAQNHINNLSFAETNLFNLFCTLHDMHPCQFKSNCDQFAKTKDHKESFFCLSVTFERKNNYDHETFTSSGTPATTSM